jgi:hypothetical protein
MSSTATSLLRPRPASRGANSRVVPTRHRSGLRLTPRPATCAVSPSLSFSLLFYATGQRP